MRAGRSMRAERTVQKIATAAALGLWLLAGCKSPTPPKILETPTAKPKPATFFDPATLGSIRGVVNFTGGAPAPALIATSTDHACTPAGELFSEEYSVHDGKLANVYAYIKTGPPAAMTQGASWMDPVVLDQQRCRFIPHVIAVTAGQRIAFRNDDPTTQTIHATPAIAGNAPIDLSLAPNAPPQMRFFRKPEPMIPVRSSQHPWQSAYINVSPTPWFAVTGPDGSFELKGLPAGVYTLGLIHEKLGEQTISITVKPQTTANAAVTYRMK